MSRELFPERIDNHPMVYAYEELNPNLAGMLKVGFTTIGVERRVAQQYPTKRPDGKKPYKIVFAETAMYSDGSNFTDHDLHRLLKKRGFHEDGEWFSCSVDDVKAAYLAVSNRTENTENRTQDFVMRPEQEEAVNKTFSYFQEEGIQPPKFLWNAKMRFGKTFATYQLAKKIKAKRVLILTFKPAVQSAWEEDLNTHIDFEGWQFVSSSSLSYDDCDPLRPIVCFGSFQDYLQSDRSGAIKAKNEWVHLEDWDLVAFDEYHFGAWKDNAKNLFKNEDEEVEEDLDKYAKEEFANAINESWLPITAKRYLYLSGTPFRAINSGEFIEDQIYNWTYSDEQRAKNNWGNNPDNPYSSLPRIVMMTYNIPDTIKKIASQGEFDEFDINEFFFATGKEADAEFKHKNEVQKWLDLIRGGHLESATDNLKLASKKPVLPYSDTRMLNVLTHTLWYLPNVASCFAMRNLLEEKQNIFYHDYVVNVCAGPKAGIGVKALEPVQKSMKDPLSTKTITLSCGKLTTGVTVKPWSGIFMLRKLSSPETYFQAAFRVQSPWVINGEAGHKQIMKEECYIFDFALDRALRQIADYSCKLNVNDTNPENNVAEFIKFLPVIAYDGSSMREINAGEVLDIAMAGTSATLLAKRWESALLVNVDNITLERLFVNEDAMNALMNIEGFRTLNQDISTIISKSEQVKKAKKDGGEITPKVKKELSDAEKEYKSKRKEIQTKLIKFATRIPVFMYLTDYREYCLKDVITQIEPALFQKVTGLGVKDFESLVSLGIFNHSLMNDAVYKFKRYEDSSLSYTGIDLHAGENVGGFDTVLTESEYQEFHGLQQGSMHSESKRNYTVEEEFDIPKVAEATDERAETESQDIEVKEGDDVYHKKFGKGKAISVEGDEIFVQFTVGQKLFEYPNAFKKGFLYL
ncbi:MAG: GIY-YIG nuclease family protein [Lactobacillales bacterium]|jgi:hypothetical protein|nr:GIY-YIG nuclease family protein [Lactobacillales bacterium]